MTVAELIEILSNDWDQDDIVMTYDPESDSEVEAHSVRTTGRRTTLSSDKQAETG